MFFTQLVLYVRSLKKKKEKEKKSWQQQEKIKSTFFLEANY